VTLVSANLLIATKSRCNCIVGFVAGAGLAGLSVTVSLHSIAMKWPEILQLLFISPFVFPPFGGLTAILRFPKTDAG
jgi:hypothetical protein